jgi:hypothetical protein
MKFKSEYEERKAHRTALRAPCVEACQKGDAICQSACKNDPVSAPNFDPLLSLHIERQLITFDS